ncbi:uncharacterized protein LOC118924420 isoform X2 [Manis pentadactyla]|uniref:uncharacterized protein LOC118924420 isoform X2 n=1 Tax=Manis pentadactyla TaxID=143292 RepID=UPI00255C6500|nr:uncharacterized protein LOC118924420 isoform X2 [Manis pentadactyla]
MQQGLRGLGGTLTGSPQEGRGVIPGKARCPLKAGGEKRLRRDRGAAVGAAGASAPGPRGCASRSLEKPFSLRPALPGDPGTQNWPVKNQGTSEKWTQTRGDACA